MGKHRVVLLIADAIVENRRDTVTHVIGGSVPPEWFPKKKDSMKAWFDNEWSVVTATGWGQGGALITVERTA